MTPTRLAFIRCALGAASLLTLCAAARAGEPNAHPALKAAAAPGWQQARDAAPKLIGHPASPRWAVVHANGEHPAVLVARRAAPAIDPNTFLVQPPVAVRWLEGSEAALAVALGQAER